MVMQINFHHSSLTFPKNFHHPSSFSFHLATLEILKSKLISTVHSVQNRNSHFHHQLYSNGFLKNRIFVSLKLKTENSLFAYDFIKFPFHLCMHSCKNRKFQNFICKGMNENVASCVGLENFGKSETFLDEIEKFRYRMVISYDGTDFFGFQLQACENTIQKEMETTIGRITGMTRGEIGLGASGRTDAGVHALGQVLHFNSTKDLKPILFQTSLNALLPPSIRVLSLSKTSSSFHARYSAIKKTYHYCICNSNIMLPFARNYQLHLPYDLNTNMVSMAANFFVGRHDFSAFANSSTVKDRDPVREIYRFDLVKTDDGFRLEVEGSGFLYKQVRNMVGVLIQVGKGLLTVDDVNILLKSKDRTQVAKVAPSAPPHGLFLASVEYPLEFDDPLLESGDQLNSLDY